MPGHGYQGGQFLGQPHTPQMQYIPHQTQQGQFISHQNSQFGAQGGMFVEQSGQSGQRNVTMVPQGYAPEYLCIDSRDAPRIRVL